MQRQVPQIQTVPKTGDFLSINQVTKHVDLPQAQHTNKVVDVPEAQTGPKTVAVPQARQCHPRYLCERLDASDDDTAVLPRNTHLPPPSGEGPWPTVKPVPPSYQPEKDSTSTLGRLPIGPTGTGSIEEAPSVSPLVSTRDKPAKHQ